MNLDAISAAQELVRREEARKSLYQFAKQAWPILEGARPFADGWHLEAMAEHLEAVVHGQIDNLLINVPPRSMKSLMVSVIYPAWVWIEHPRLQWVFTSYAHALSLRDSLRTRRLIESRWYQARWGDRYQIRDDQNTKLRFDNTASGHRIATSVDGHNTGEGGDIIVSDDPNSAGDTSDTMLQTTIDWWDQVMSLRLNDQRTGHRIVVQQRTHEKDLSGHIIAKHDPSWTHLMLPLEFEKKRACVTVILPSSGIVPWRDPRTHEGESLWGDRWSPKEIAKMKYDLGSEYAIAGQLQQRPSPEAGGIMKKAWFQWWKKPEPPKMQFIIQSWDTALGVKEGNSYSACTTWGVFRDDLQIPNVIALSCYRDRIQYPDLRKLAKRMSIDYRDDDLNNPRKVDEKEQLQNRFRPDIVMVEKKGLGFALIQDLSRADIVPVPFNPDKYGDKIERVKIVSHIIEGGRLWLPARPPEYLVLRPFAQFILDQCTAFPNADSRDVVDTLVQVLLRLSTTGWVWNPSDTPPPEEDEGQVDTQEEAFY